MMAKMTSPVNAARFPLSTLCFFLCLGLVRRKSDVVVDHGGHGSEQGFVCSTLRRNAERSRRSGFARFRPQSKGQRFRVWSCLCVTTVPPHLRRRLTRMSPLSGAGLGAAAIAQKAY